jgi:hypothetical protein
MTMGVVCGVLSSLMCLAGVFFFVFYLGGAAVGLVP